MEMYLNVLKNITRQYVMKNKKQTRLIKRYLNRRLYDTSTSTYIVQDDIKQMIMDGEAIEIVDVKSGKNITRSILLQIILDEEVHGIPMFSDEFLFQVIRFYGNATQNALSPFLEQGLLAFKKMQGKFLEQVKEAYGSTKIPSSFDFWHDFLNSQAPEFEESIKKYIENNANIFSQMHEHIESGTRELLNYMQFPFIKPKGTK